LNRVWDGELNWYNPQDVIMLEKERKKWSTVIKEKDQKIGLLESSVSSLKYTVDTLKKLKIVKALSNNA